VFTKQKASREIHREISKDKVDIRQRCFRSLTEYWYFCFDSNYLQT